MRKHAMLALVTPTQRVQEYVIEQYINPARARGQSRVEVVSGDVHRALGLSNRVPLVCQALRSKKLLQENGIVIESEQGPPSGQSTTVRVTYRLSPQAAEVPKRHPFLELRGIARDLFREYGGGESFFQAGRATFDRSHGGEDS